MRAVRFHEFGHADVLRVEQVPDPEPGPGEVTIRIRAAALNHLDVDVREGTSRFPVAFPHTLGVELAGELERVGDGVEGWSPGDRVNPFIMAPCGRCRYCRTGRESLCLAAGFISFSTGGGYAEKVAVSSASSCGSRTGSRTWTRRRSRSHLRLRGTCCSRAAACRRGRPC